MSLRTCYTYLLTQFITFAFSTKIATNCQQTQMLDLSQTPDPVGQILEVALEID